MSEKSQTIGDFADLSDYRQKSVPVYTVLNKVLHGEALPRVLRPYHLYAFA